MTNREHWQRWRAILNKIINHPDYNYSAPYQRKILLLKMAKFAMQEMGKYNTAHWKNN